MGEDVTLISSGKEAAKYAEICLVEKNLLTDRTENGHNTFYVSDSTELFEENAKNFLGTKINGEIFSSNL
jgi:glutamate racemase